VRRKVDIAGRSLGDGEHVFIVAEIGINHNGSLDIAKKLIDLAAAAGCDAVKFQKRTPELCVPAEQQIKMRETPWGYITYLEYRHKVELDLEAYKEIDRYCHEKSIIWFASCWDEEALVFMEQFDLPCYKIPSAILTDHALLKQFKDTARPLILSTGMSSMEQIREAVALLGAANLLIAHSTSAYPCALEELNLRMIATLREEFDCPIGYSGHEVGLATTAASVALGANHVERHITLDRAMWGSDQAASVEAVGFRRLVKDIRAIETALGDGVKKVYESELTAMNKLRRVNSAETQ
jgi:N-acetylneuraminate synthase